MGLFQKEALRNLEKWRISLERISYYPDGLVGRGGYADVSKATLECPSGIVDVVVKDFKLKTVEMKASPLRLALVRAQFQSFQRFVTLICYTTSEARSRTTNLGRAFASEYPSTHRIFPR